MNAPTTSTYISAIIAEHLAFCWSAGISVADLMLEIYARSPHALRPDISESLELAWRAMQRPK